MKLIVSCIAILAVVNLAQCTDTSDELMESVRVHMLKNYIQEKQAMAQLTERIEAVCPGYGSRFENAIRKVEECTNLIDEDNETMCSAIKNHFEKCSKPVVTLFEECLPERSKDIPSFITQAILSTSEYICKTDGEHILELSNPCVKSQNYRTQRCLRKIRSRLQQYNSKVPSKDEICEFLSSFRGCFTSHLHASCGHTKTREAFLNLYDAALTPCKGPALNEIEIVNPYRNWKREEIPDPEIK